MNFSLQRGEVLALVRQSGAGKSALLKCIAGRLAADRGKVNDLGELGFLLEMSAGFSPVISGRDNVVLRGRLMGKSGTSLKRYLGAVEEFVDIGEFFDSPVQFYSSGMKSRLGFAASSAMKPDILIIDEVLAVGGLAFRLKCYERVNELARNAAVIFVSHSIGQVARICNRGVFLEKGFLEKGSILFDDSVQKVLELYQDKLSGLNDLKRGCGYNAELTSISLFVNDVSFELGRILGYGEMLKLKIDVSRLPHGAQHRVLLRDASQSIIMDWNSARCATRSPVRVTSVTASLGPVELSPGACSLSLQVTSADEVDHLCIPESVPFRVGGEYYNAVMVRCTALWGFR